MIKRMVIMLVILAVVLGGLWVMHGVSSKFIDKYITALNSQAQVVSATTAKTSDWTRQLEAVGSLRAVRGADLGLQAAGVVTKIHFHSGQDVKKGSLLLSLDDDAEVAHLKALEAAARLAKITYERDKKQYAARAISKQVVDSDRATLAQAQANVQQQQALVDHKQLHAPFSGRLGLRLVDLGQYLTAGTTVVTLQSLSPIYIDFHLPQQALAEVRVGMPVKAGNDTWPSESFPGKITAINPKVDVATRNVKIRAELDNADGKLLPGMYVTVDITTGEPKPFITLPQTAIDYHPYGDTVFVITPESNAAKQDEADTTKAGDKNTDAGNKADDEKLVVHQQFVKVGETRGDQIQILTGLKAGDRVVTSGQMKLRNGTSVKINNDLPPLNEPHPTPRED